MVRFANITIPVLLILILAIAAYWAFDPAEMANKKRDSLLRTYASRLKPTPEKYLDQMFILADKVCYSPASTYVRQGSCNQGDVYSLNISLSKLESVACGLDTTWPRAGDPWVICAVKSQDDE